MEIAIALLIVAFIVWVIYNANFPVDIDAIADEKPGKNRQKPIYAPFDSPADKPGKQRDISSYYDESTDDPNGDGSALIKKFSGKRADDELTKLLAEIESDAKPKKRARSPVKVSVSGSIAFDYIDAKHEQSSRVVDVKEVDARHISGYCRTARSFRTFLIEGVVSDVTDTETGEVMPLNTWIKQAKKAARRDAPKK